MSLIFRCFLSCTNNFADMDISQLITLNIYTGIEYINSLAIKIMPEGALVRNWTFYNFFS